MTLEEEKEFLKKWEDRATGGGVLTVPPMHAALVERLGYAVPMSTTYRLKLMFQDEARFGRMSDP